MFEHLHYFVAHRINLNEIFELIEQEQYFVLYGPSLTGKTTAI